MNGALARYSLLSEDGGSGVRSAGGRRLIKIVRFISLAGVQAWRTFHCEQRLPIGVDLRKPVTSDGLVVGKIIKVVGLL